jgi:hypothetical protein
MRIVPRRQGDTPNTRRLRCFSLVSNPIHRPDPIVHLVLRVGFGEEGSFVGDDAEGEGVFLDGYGGDGVDGAEVDDAGEGVFLLGSSIRVFPE